MKQKRFKSSERTGFTALRDTQWMYRFITRRTINVLFVTCQKIRKKRYILSIAWQKSPFRSESVKNASITRHRWNLEIPIRKKRILFAKQRNETTPSQCMMVTGNDTDKNMWGSKSEESHRYHTQAVNLRVMSCAVYRRCAPVQGLSLHESWSQFLANIWT